MPTKRASLASPISGLRLPKLMWSVISMTEPGGISCAQAAGGVGEDEVVDAERLQRLQRRPHDAGIAVLVVVRRGRPCTATGAPPMRPMHERPGMARHARHRKALELAVGNRDRVLDVARRNRRGRSRARCRSRGAIGVRARISARRSRFARCRDMLSASSNAFGSKIAQRNSFDDARRVAEMHERLRRAELLQPLPAAAAGRDARHLLGDHRDLGDAAARPPSPCARSRRSPRTSLPG